jgi:predicted GNAT family N-acyltransferase
MINHKIYDTLPQQAKDIRCKVFVEEQGFKNEFDDIDNIAKHIVIFDNQKPIAVGRYYFNNDDGDYHIGRIAVLSDYRKYGYGKAIMQLIENDIKQNTNAKRIVLSAQVQAKNFYKQCGYEQTGATYYDEHCEHIKMFKNI